MTLKLFIANPIDKNFLLSVENYCKRNNSLLITKDKITDYLPRKVYDFAFKYLNDFGEGSIVEKIDDHHIIRHIQPNKDGSFVDLEIRYSPDGKIKNEPAVVWLKSGV